jgi:hypothetical protein
MQITTIGLDIAKNVFQLRPVAVLLDLVHPVRPADRRLGATSWTPRATQAPQSGCCRKSVSACIARRFLSLK